MVLRNAPRNPMVDSSHRGDLRPRPLQHRDRIPTLLQLPRRVRQIPILAPPNHIPLLWQTKPRPHLPRVLSPAILATPGGILRPIAGAFRLVDFLRDELAADHFAVSLAAVFGDRVELESGVYLGAAESGDKVEFSGAVGVSGAVFAVGAYGVYSDCVQDGAKG